MHSSAVLILVVEDDRAAGEEMKRALEDAGFRVLLVESGEKATSAFDENAGEVGGLIADVKLGGNVSGWDVARHAREVNQDLPVVYITGFYVEDWASQGVPKSTLVQLAWLAHRDRSGMRENSSFTVGRVHSVPGV